MSSNLGFLKGFKKELESMDGVGLSSAPPRYFYHTGNYCLNKISSGSFYRGGIAAQGRVSIVAGPSGAGKSFIAANIIREAQSKGAHILVIDSENALSDDFVTKIGVDPSSNYTYVGVVTVQNAVNVVSRFLAEYKKEYGNAENAPPVLIVIDSLDMLMTESELENYDKGIQKGDMGGKNKSLKSFLKTLVQDIKTLNVAVLATAQCYQNQNVLNGEGAYIVADAIKFSASSITMVTKLKLKEGTDTIGIRMKCEGYKTRYCKPFSVVVIEVPYETGMDPYSGLVEVAMSLKVIEKAGTRYKLTGDTETWFGKDIYKHAEKILASCEEISTDKRLDLSAFELDSNS